MLNISILPKRLIIIMLPVNIIYQHIFLPHIYFKWKGMYVCMCLCPCMYRPSVSRLPFMKIFLRQPNGKYTTANSKLIQYSNRSGFVTPTTFTNTYKIQVKEVMRKRAGKEKIKSSKETTKTNLSYSWQVVRQIMFRNMILKIKPSADLHWVQ